MWIKMEARPERGNMTEGKGKERGVERECKERESERVIGACRGRRRRVEGREGVMQEQGGGKGWMFETWRRRYRREAWRGETGEENNQRKDEEDWLINMQVIEENEKKRTHDSKRTTTTKKCIWSSRIKKEHGPKGKQNKNLHVVVFKVRQFAVTWFFAVRVCRARHINTTNAARLPWPSGHKQAQDPTSVTPIIISHNHTSTSIKPLKKWAIHYNKQPELACR